VARVLSGRLHLGQFRLVDRDVHAHAREAVALHAPPQRGLTISPAIVMVEGAHTRCDLAREMSNDLLGRACTNAAAVCGRA